MKWKSKLAGVLALSFALLYGAHLLQVERAQDDDGSTKPREQSAGVASLGWGSDDLLTFASFNSEVYRQSLWLDGFYVKDILLLQIQERRSTADDWDSGMYEYPTAYDVISVGYLEEGDYLIAGALENGELILERWFVTLGPGCWTGRAQELSRSQLLAGVTTASPGTTEPFLVGGRFVPMADRQGAPTIERVEIYRGRMPPWPVRNVAGDGLSGKAVILSSDPGVGEGALYELDLSGGELRLLYAEHEAPGLSNCNTVSARLNDAGTWYFTCYSSSRVGLGDGVNVPFEDMLVFERTSPDSPLTGPNIYPDWGSWRSAHGGLHWLNGTQ